MVENACITYLFPIKLIWTVNTYRTATVPQAEENFPFAAELCPQPSKLSMNELPIYVFTLDIVAADEWSLILDTDTKELFLNYNT